MIRALGVCAVLSGCAASANHRAAIEKVLSDQVEAWNRGDVERFLEGYWKSDRTVFAAEDKIHRGFEAMAERYRRSFPTRDAMGTLTFSELTFESIEEDQAVVTGRWALERAQDRPGGAFTLIFRRFPEGWRIVHDHTSSRP
ncbi:MAG: nuclear transport factor 2 family protein [Planctomycetes bacterium]|nr:nuclear transport factor 2 family protein [Planctomycetota bacterium]